MEGIGGLSDKDIYVREGDCKKVFIVDDETSVVDWLVNNVEWEAYNCEIVGYSTEAAVTLTYMEENAVDLLITDVYMPGMSGLDLIKIVKEKFPSVFVIVISAYDKFEYIKEALKYGIINYCLKPIDVNELYECLKTVEVEYQKKSYHYPKYDVTLFRNSILQRLLYGESHELRINEQCEIAGINLEVPIYQIAIMDTRNLERNKCVSVIKSFSAGKKSGVYYVLDYCMNLVFFFWGNNGCDEKEEKKIMDILRQEKLLSNTRLYIGKPLSSYRQIAASYQVCYDFLHAGFLFQEKVVRTADYPYEKYLSVIKNMKLQQLVNSLAGDNDRKVIGMIAEILEDYHSEAEKMTEIICLAVFLTKSIPTIYLSRDNMLQKSYLTALPSSVKMLEWMKHFCKIIYDKGEQNRHFHPHVNYAIQEITNNYADNTLSVQKIAMACNVSAAYFGQLFKEQTGEFFNEYLLKVRLKMAEIFLRENKLRVMDVISKVGFSNQSYFNKVFRRNYGISPAEYRRRCIKEDL